MKFAQGKVAIIVGGGGTLGFACAIEFFKYGLKGITIVDIDEFKARKTALKINQLFGDDSASFIKANATIKSELDEAFKATINKFNQLDIVVNNACCRNVHCWERVIDVNVKGMLFGCTLAIDHYLPRFKSGEEGVIINISTVAGLFNSPTNPAYSIGKLAAIGMARTFGQKEHYEATKVRVVTVCLQIRRGVECQTDCKHCRPFYHLVDRNKCIGVLGKGINVALTISNNGSVWLLSDSSLVELKYPTLQETMSANQIIL